MKAMAGGTGAAGHLEAVLLEEGLDAALQGTLRAEGRQRAGACAEGLGPLGGEALVPDRCQRK